MPPRPAALAAALAAALLGATLMAAAADAAPPPPLALAATPAATSLACDGDAASAAACPAGAAVVHPPAAAAKAAGYVDCVSPGAATDARCVAGRSALAAASAEGGGFDAPTFPPADTAAVLAACPDTPLLPEGAGSDAGALPSQAELDAAAGQVRREGRVWRAERRKKRKYAARNSHPSLLFS
jgi:hypothetical protein